MQNVIFEEPGILTEYRTIINLVLDNKAEFIKKVKLVISNHDKTPIMALETGRPIILRSFLPAAVTYGQQ